MKKLILLGFLLPAFLHTCSDNQDASDAFGNFESDPVLVSAQSQGQILALGLEEGQKLSKGQQVGVIDTMQLFLRKHQLLAGIQTINTRFATIDAQITSMRIQIENAEREQKRIARLLEDGAATEKQRDDVNGNLTLLRSQNKALESQKFTVTAEKNGMKLQVSQLEDQLKKAYIINPTDGIVLQKYKQEGEIVAPGQALYKIADMDMLILRVYVSGGQLSEVSLGKKVTVRIDYLEDIRELEGEVIWISSQAEFTPKIIQTREERVNLVYATKVAVKNDGMLKIGMPGELKF